MSSSNLNYLISVIYALVLTIVYMCAIIKAYHAKNQKEAAKMAKKSHNFKLSYHAEECLQVLKAIYPQRSMTELVEQAISDMATECLNREAGNTAAAKKLRDQIVMRLT